MRARKCYTDSMFLMYVDESGDSGANTAVTDYYLLTAIVVHELRWKAFIDDLATFRKHLRDTKGLKLRQEIHAAQFITGSGGINSVIAKHDRLDILKQCLDWLGSQTDISIYGVIIDKKAHLNGDIFELSWKLLAQRFENTLSYKNFPGPANAEDKGMIISDRSNEKKLRLLMRKMHKYNPVPSITQPGTYRDMPLRYLIEDPNMRDSIHSYVVQMADVVAYFLMQKKKANSYIRRKGARNYFDRLKPVLNVYVNRDGSGTIEN